MALRDTERATIAKTRAAHAREFALAEETLDVATRIFSHRQLTNPRGDALLGRVVVGHVTKIIHVFWAVIALSERALPASSTVRELAEAVVSLAYLLKEDSVERAQLYRDHIVVRDLRDMNRRLSDPDSADIVTPEMRRLIEGNVAAVIARRTEPVFAEMKKWRTWGGPFSVEAMAQKAGIPGSLMTLLYAVESRAPHAMDIASHIALTPAGDLAATLPAAAERHLVPSTLLVLMSLHLATQAFGIDHERDIEPLHKRVLELSGVVDDEQPARQTARPEGGDSPA